MRRSVLALGLLALALVLVACSGTKAAPPTPGPSDDPATGPVVVARDLDWVEKTVKVPAGTPFALVLDNQEDFPHNILIEDADGKTVFDGEIIGKKKITYQVPALAAGSYTFVCKVHLDMKGTLVAG